MIETEQMDRVRVVRLASPATSNALDDAVLAALVSELAAADADRGVHVIILTGTDTVFCADDPHALDQRYEWLHRIDEERHVRGLWPATSTPVLGAINGTTSGAGLELALGCDFLFASHRATFLANHVTVGVTPAAGLSVRLPQLVGVNRARQMLLSARPLDASTACEWGLVNEVVPHDLLLARTLEVAHAIAEQEPAVVSELRARVELLGHRGDPDAYREEVALAQRWRSDRFREASFNERRDGTLPHLSEDA